MRWLNVVLFFTVLGCGEKVDPDLDSDGDGWSDEYGNWNAAFSVMGEEPASSWLTYMILGTVMLISSGLALVVRYSRSASSLERGISKEKKGGDSNA